jgi:hypothetical protein
MLREQSGKQFFEWQAYAELEPFSERRADYRTASIVKALWDIARDTKKHPSAFKLDDFVLNFEEATKKKPQTPEQQKSILMLITAAHTGIPLNG